MTASGARNEVQPRPGASPDGASRTTTANATARSRFETGPASATLTGSLRGFLRFAHWIGTGFAQPSTIGEWNRARAAGSKRDPNGSTCGSGLSVSRPRSRAVVSPFHSATSPWAHSCTTTLNTSAGRIRKNVGSKCNRTLLPGWIRKAFVGDYRDLRGESRLASARESGEALATPRSSRCVARATGAHPLTAPVAARFSAALWCGCERQPGRHDRSPGARPRTPELPGRALPPPRARGCRPARALLLHPQRNSRLSARDARVSRAL